MAKAIYIQNSTDICDYGCGEIAHYQYKSSGKKCCSSHYKHCPAVKKKTSETNLERYGSVSPFGSEVIKEKIKQTNLKKYGVEHASQSEEVKRRQEKTFMEKFGVKRPMHSKELKKKQQDTMTERHGAYTSFLMDSFDEKRKATSLERYGYENPMQSDQVKQKVIDTVRRLYGVDWVLSAPEVIQQRIETLLERYGVDNPSKNKESHEKQCRTRKEKYGHEYAPWINSNSKKSKESQKWLKETNAKEFEVLIEGFIVDGYDPETNTIYEFNGDFWHGNPDIYDSAEIHPVIGVTYGELYKKTKDREMTLKSKGFNVISIWGSEYAKRKG